MFEHVQPVAIQGHGLIYTLAFLQPHALPANWATRVRNAVTQWGTPTDAGFKLETATIRVRLPFLHDLYTCAELASAVGHHTGAGKVRPTPYDPAGVQVHLRQEPGSATAPGAPAGAHLILFASEAPPSGGGDLVIEHPYGRARITPQPGRVVLLNGPQWPHCVEPLTSPWERVSIPMQFAPK